MYTVRNFRTKKALIEAVESGDSVATFQPGYDRVPTFDGRITLEGPHYPEPHRWYAGATVKAGVIVKGSVT
jgi:hypothetical protein